MTTQDEIRAAFKAGASTTEKTVVTNASSLNLRDTPSTSGKILLQLPKGSTVHAFSASDAPSGWLAVYVVDNKNLKTFGFVSAQYVG